jgi:hypothetical protein
MRPTPENGHDPGEASKGNPDLCEGSESLYFRHCRIRFT